MMIQVLIPSGQFMHDRNSMILAPRTINCPMHGGVITIVQVAVFNIKRCKHTEKLISITK